MFSRIQNPETGKWVNVNGSAGQKILKNYLKQSGGAKVDLSGLANLKQTISKVDKVIKDLRQGNPDENIKSIEQVMNEVNKNSTTEIAAAARRLFTDDDSPISKKGLDTLSERLKRLHEAIETKLVEYNKPSDTEQDTTAATTNTAAVEQ